MRRAAFAVAALMALVANAWWSNDGEPGFGKLSKGLETPHIDFASKNAHKPTVLVTAFGAGQREVAELWERFDLTPVLLPTKSAESANPWETARRTGKTYRPYLPAMDEAGYREALEKILAKLPSCDAVLVGKTDLSLFPTNDAARILARVREGAGLVYVTHADKKAEIAGVELKEIPADTFFPVALVPALAGTKLYEGTLGKGRVLEVVYRHPRYEVAAIRTRAHLETLTPYDADDPLYYDFYHAFLGKCLWRVTGREKVGKTGGGGERIEKSFNELGEETEAGSRSAVLKLTRWLNDKGETVDYEVAGCEVAGCEVERMAIRFEKDAFLPGEAIPCRVTIPPTLNSQPSTLNLHVSLTDEYGREIWRRDFPEASGELAFDIAFAHARSRFAQVRAQLRKPSNSVVQPPTSNLQPSLLDEAFAKLYFNTVAGDKDDFCFSMWSDHAVNSRVSKIGLRQMRAAGVDNLMECSLVYSCFTPQRRHDAPRWIKEAGLNYSSWINELHGPLPKQMPADGTCGYFEKCEKLRATGVVPGKPQNTRWVKNKTHVQDTAEGARDLGVYFYNIGDENMLSYMGRAEEESCFCGACQKRFRAYLKRTYGTLEAMNREYRTKYAAWDDVKALPLVEAAKKRRLPLWADFRMFMEEQFLDLHLHAKAEVQEIDPVAAIGSEGYVYPANSFTGHCFYKSLPHFTFGAPYFNARDVHALKYFPKGAMKAAWYGTYAGRYTPAVTRRTPWRYLFAGLDGAFWYYAAFSPKEGAFSNCAIFRPDLTYLESFEASAKEMAAIRASGIGMLMHGVQPAMDSLAFHYSNPCLHASTINPGETSWELSHADFGMVADEAGLPYEFLSPPEIEKGGVPARTKALVLPYSQALSDKECAAIRAFVERGGIVIADEIPGIMDEHCAVREKSPIEDLFGKRLEPKTTGKGCAVLTEDYFRGVDGRVGMGSAGGLAAAFRRLVALGGVKAPATVADECGSLRAADIWRKEGMTLVCLLGPAEKSAENDAKAGAEGGTKTLDQVGGSARRIVTFDHDVVGYDLAAGGREFGRGRRFEVTLEKTVGRILVFTEKALEPIALKLSKAAIARGEAVAIDVTPVHGCALVSVCGPDGKEVFSTRTASGRCVFPSAWNEPTGVYTIKARSAVGGFEAMGKVEVRD